ncbi:hypothetical protein, variant [Thecamonas trahens ATCC 50062]|uniref:Uncharacterized protein n=1 Tax=Thecamonas trahens ATCC 50062 TaxID=461836 RepID=A0A0L0DN85_THETB|nr:hypothetical protein AMSG_11641 [Thecamonas trahens ATCC 50062]XP_013762040.1 hypothetical protein, variant [Thecamonas trahens ATCC 50062]KNC53480.1 hypothetical protein, variant [Thecamonas trahens ATCC 50062]KNC53481.1 hypothetical protein AMSG_11641 [Thecamonas trahens ATCC 50062]|eukprot:XP_013762039.1 hypothetical protein AMSG_11641 [Thecamonas trahens ATCC 50062]
MSRQHSSPRPSTSSLSSSATSRSRSLLPTSTLPRTRTTICITGSSSTTSSSTRCTRSRPTSEPPCLSALPGHSRALSPAQSPAHQPSCCAAPFRGPRPFFLAHPARSPPHLSSPPHPSWTTIRTASGAATVKSRLLATTTTSAWRLVTGASVASCSRLPVAPSGWRVGP